MGWSVEFVAPDAAPSADLPPPWRPLVTEPDPRARCTAAAQLWNADWTALVPRFWSRFTERLVDVRVARAGRGALLVYVAPGDDGTPLAWVGWAPRADGARPPFWESLPEPARAFLDGVHDGFTGNDSESYGLLPRAFMTTFAEYAESPDGLPGWDDDSPVRSTRLLRVATNGGGLEYCVSPDLPAGTLALVYEGDVDPQPFGEGFDEFLMWYFAGL